MPVPTAADFRSAPISRSGIRRAIGRADRHTLNRTEVPMRGRRIVTPAIGLGLALAFCSASVGAAQSGDTIVMSGLHNPRGLTFGPGEPGRNHGQSQRAALYVAEAGTGGPLCTPQIRGPVCVGLTGSISRYRHGQQQRIVQGLPSYAPFAPPSAGAVGASDVSFG